jgi:hypothetical protein
MFSHYPREGALRLEHRYKPASGIDAAGTAEKRSRTPIEKDSPAFFLDRRGLAG